MTDKIGLTFALKETALFAVLELTFVELTVREGTLIELTFEVDMFDCYSRETIIPRGLQGQEQGAESLSEFSQSIVLARARFNH